MATISDFGIPGISQGILQPKLKDSWRVRFANFGAGEDAQPVSAQAIEVSRPQITFDEIQLDRYNSRAWVASKHTWSDMNLTIEDDVTGLAARAVAQQMEAQKKIIGTEGPSYLARTPEGSGYKFVTYLEMLDGAEQPIELWTIEGCWLKDCNWNDLSYADADKVTITLTIRFDHARQDIGGYNFGQGIATGGPGA